MIYSEEQMFMKNGGEIGMIYLKQFRLPDIGAEESGNDRPHEYPYSIFPYKQLENIDFGPVTVFYGNNGSGKSTLLNIISKKLGLPHNTAFRPGKYFDGYVDSLCSCIMETDDSGRTAGLPFGSRLIASEDIFDHIMKVRSENLIIDRKKEEQEAAYFSSKYGQISFESLADYEMLKTQNAARRKTMTKFITERAGKNLDQFSNGETALSYFNDQFVSGRLYLLDEPENSLSPGFQMKLADMIMECAYYCDCQFVIASHSPFILSIKDAVIYDLDSEPAAAKEWYELENMKIYYNLFHGNGSVFEPGRA